MFRFIYFSSKFQPKAVSIPWVSPWAKKPSLRPIPWKKAYGIHLKDNMLFLQTDSLLAIEEPDQYGRYFQVESSEIRDLAYALGITLTPRYTTNAQGKQRASYPDFQITLPEYDVTKCKKLEARETSIGLEFRWYWDDEDDFLLYSYRGNYLVQWEHGDTSEKKTET